MKATLLTVYHNTPEKYKKSIEYHSARLGLDLHLIDSTKENKGYAENLNELVRANLKYYDVFILANPDIDLSGVPKDELFKAAGHFDIWSYRMLQNGTTYYGGTIDYWRMSGGLRSDRPSERFVSCDFVSGSCMAVKKEVIEKIGYLDESFFMYYEDVEYCRRAVKAGLKVGIDIDQWYEHFESSDNNPKKKKYLAKNRIKFMWQNGSLFQKTYEILRFPKTLFEEGLNLL